MKKNIFVALSLILFFAQNSFAADQGVIINEVQLSPKENSFIELFNAGSIEIDLTGWYIKKITSTGSEQNFIIASRFDGKKILANNYFLAAKESYSIVPADINWPNSYDLAKNNSIVLYNKNNETVDRVDWADIESNQSLQKTADGNWITATPTPKTQNATSNQTIDSSQKAGDATQQSDQTQQTSENQITTSQNSTFQIQNSVQADAGENIIALVGQEITFDASKSQGGNLSYEWNFGDGTTSKEKAAKHKYNFASKYIAVLTISDGQNISQSQITASIYPSGVYINEFTPSPAGSDDNEWIEIYNSNNFAVNLSGWKLSDSGKLNFTIPQNTLIASQSYLVFPRSATKIALNNDNDSVRFYYPENILIDEIRYEKAKEGYSAARKQDGNFVWTKNLTPSMANIFASEKTGAQNIGSQTQSVSAKENGVKNLTSSKKSSLIVFDNFIAKNLINSANAQIVAEYPKQTGISSGNVSGSGSDTALENKNFSANILSSINNYGNIMSKLILILATLMIFSLMWRVMKK